MQLWEFMNTFGQYTNGVNQYPPDNIFKTFNVRFDSEDLKEVNDD